MKKLLLALSILLCASCITYEKCTDKYGVVKPVDYSLPLEYKLPVKYVFPADIFRFSFSATENSKDTTSRSGVNVSYKLDSTDNSVNIGVKVPEKVIRDTIIFRDTIPIAASCTELTPPKSRIKRVWESYKKFSAPALLILLYVLHRTRKKHHG